MIVNEMKADMNYFTGFLYPYSTLHPTSTASTPFVPRTFYVPSLPVWFRLCV